MAVWSRKTFKYLEIFLRFFEQQPIGYAIFKIMFRKFPSRHRSTLLCLNVVKFGRREISEIVRYLLDKKQNFACLSNCRYCADRVQILPGPCSNNVLRVLQISSKLVHFWRSCSRTRKHRQIAPQSETNIRPKPSFEPNNKRVRIHIYISSELSVSTVHSCMKINQWKWQIRPSGDRFRSDKNPSSRIKRNWILERGRHVARSVPYWYS